MLRKRVRLKTEELRLVNEILKTFVRFDDIEKVFDKILQIFYSFWSIEAGFIALKEEGDKLKVHTAFGFLPSEVEKAIYSKGEGITGLTYQLGIPLYATEDELLNKTGLLKRLKGKDIAFFTAPIKVGDKTVGVLGIFVDVRNIQKGVEKILETLSVVGSILGSYLGLKEKDLLPTAIAEELMRDIDSGKWEGEYLLTFKSQKTKNILLLLERLKKLTAPVLFIGETGGGKTTFAKLLHHMAQSADKPLEIFDPRGLMGENLIQVWTEKKRSARGGTLIVKRVEYLPPNLQEELLKVIKEGQTRVLATASPLLERVFEEGKFLPELYEQLKVVEIEVPSLSKRKEDIEVLTKFIFYKYRTLSGAKAKLSPEAVKPIEENPPKDNVRGLERLIKRLLILFGDRELITSKEVELFLPKGEIESTTTPGEVKSFPEQLAEEEKRKILEALEKTNYVKSRAAKLLGYTLRQLDYRLKKYGIEVKKKP